MELLTLVVLFFFGWGLSDFLSVITRLIIKDPLPSVWIALAQLAVALVIIFTVLHYVEVVVK